MPTFKLRFTEHNGEQEYCHDYTFIAHDLKDANEKAHEYLMDYYGEEDAEDVTKMKEYWYLGGTICIRKICLGTTDTIKDNFTEEELVVLLEAARVALDSGIEDEGYISPILEDMDLSDNFIQPLIEKLNNFMTQEAKES